MAEEPSGDDQAEEPSSPLGGLAEEVRSRRAGSDEPTADEGFGLDEFFREETYDAIESDSLWESLEAEPDTEDGIESGDEPTEFIVSKRSYCETCEHFAEPPAVHCTHPGTRIVEFVDIDHVRLRNCPIVAQRRAIGDEDEGRMTPGSFGNQ